MVAILLNRYGEWIRVRIEKHLGLWVALGAAVLVLGFVVAVQNDLKVAVRRLCRFAGFGLRSKSCLIDPATSSRCPGRPLRRLAWRLSIWMIAAGAELAAGRSPPLRFAPPSSAFSRRPSRPCRITPQQAGLPAASPPAREENPGLINEIGKMFEKSLSVLPTLKSPR